MIPIGSPWPQRKGAAVIGDAARLVTLFGINLAWEAMTRFERDTFTREGENAQQAWDNLLTSTQLDGVEMFKMMNRGSRLEPFDGQFRILYQIFLYPLVLIYVPFVPLSSS